jgi:hypothetical protein
MNNRLVIACLAGLAAAAASLPAAAADDLFAAMARLVAHNPASEPLTGEWKDGNLVDMWNTGSGVESHVMSSGGDPCVLVHLWIGEREGELATASTKTYDFRKLVAARFLADADDRAAAVSRGKEDPEVTEMLLEGKAWSTHRIVRLDPANPSFHQEIEDGWSIVVLGQEDRTAIAAALDVIHPQCFARR